MQRRLRAEAASLVDEHWDAVAALARELLERKTLDGYEAAWIVAIAEGENAKRELARYRRFRTAPARVLTPEEVQAALAAEQIQRQKRRRREKLP